MFEKGDDKMSKEEVKQKIIYSAIMIIERDGIQNATVRKIAEHSGVNIAAINYHFGSKEKLFSIVLNATLHEGFVENINDYENMWAEKPKEALQLFLKDTLEGTVNYPNLTKAHLTRAFLDNNYETDSVMKINEFLTKLHGLIRNILNTEDDIESRMTVIQLFSSILMVGMMPGVFNDFYKMGLENSEKQEQFVEVLLNNFVK